MKKIPAVAVLSALSFLPSLAHASGFALNEESATTLGTAFAGAAVSNEPAVQFTNPAGISGLKGNQIEVGGTLYHLDAPTFQNQGTSSLVGTPVGGDETGDDQTIEVPYIYYTHQISNDLTFGIGLYSPFGLVTTYSPQWVGRYSAVESHLNTVEVSPVIAYQINNQLSVGFGPTFRYTEAKLTQAIDFGSIGAALGFGTQPGSADGAAKIEGDGFGYGFKFGMKYNPTEDTELGFGYRSRMTTRLNGQANYGLSATGQAISGATGAFTNTSAHTDIDTPQSADISIAQHITKPLTLYGDLLWTGWSTFKNIEISYQNPAQGTTTIDEKWKDTIRASIGASYDLDQDWTVRCGYSFDQSPVKDATYTTARIPDGDRHWLAVGAGYKVNANLRLDASYDHLFLASQSADNVEAGAGTLVGNFQSIGADLFSLSATYAF